MKISEMYDSDVEDEELAQQDGKPAWIPSRLMRTFWQYMVVGRLGLKLPYAMVDDDGFSGEAAVGPGERVRVLLDGSLMLLVSKGDVGRVQAWVESKLADDDLNLLASHYRVRRQTVPEGTMIDIEPSVFVVKTLEKGSALTREDR